MVEERSLRIHDQRFGEYHRDLDIVTPEPQCYADTCQKAIAAEATAFAELKNAHGAYKTAIDDYKDRAKTYNNAVTNKMDLKASTLSAPRGLQEHQAD